MLMNIMAYGKDFVYNVGGRDSISIKTLAQEVCSVTGSTLTIDNRQKKQAIEEIKVSPDKVQLDISKICSEFGLTCFKPLREGLVRTVEWNKDKWNLQMK